MVLMVEWFVDVDVDLNGVDGRMICWCWCRFEWCWWSNDLLMLMLIWMVLMVEWFADVDVDLNGVDGRMICWCWCWFEWCWWSNDLLMLMLIWMLLMVEWFAICEARLVRILESRIDSRLDSIYLWFQICIDVNLSIKFLSLASNCWLDFKHEDELFL